MAYINQEEIFSKTNGGLDIILNYFPQAQICVDKPNSKFKVRANEKTASANLKLLSDGVWVMTDFGGDQKPRNAISVVMQEEACDFKQALNKIAAMFNIDAEKSREFYSSEYSKRDATKDEKPGDYFFERNEKLTESELKTIGKYIKQEVCDTYSLFSLKSYSIVKKDKNNPSKTIVHTYSSTYEYPIFLYDYEEFQKVYQPLNQDKKYRFMYFGTRPKEFIFGLEQAKKVQKQIEKTAPEDAKSKDLKIPTLVLCSGDRDALNVAAAGFPVIWLNSESAVLQPKDYKQIMSICNELCNIADLDPTGQRTANNLGLKYLNIKKVELPKELTKMRDFRGNFCKDVTDFFHFYPIKQFQKLIDTAIPMRFWDEEHKFKNNEYQKTVYKVNNVQMYNFLNVCGFCRIENKNVKEGYSFVKINANSVQILEDKNDMKSFIHNFLQERNLPIELRNAFYRSPYLSENSLSNLPKVKIDFDDCTKNSQLLFFENKVWNVTNKGIEEHKRTDIKKYVWEEEVIKHKVKLTDMPFDIYKENGEWVIDFNEPKCLFFQFLVYASNMHWRKEEEGKELEVHEIQENINHLVNKIYSIGYLLHKYKSPSKPWAVFAMDNKISEGKESHGGSGKSVCFKAIRYFMQSIIFEGRNAKLTDNNHIYDRVTEHIDYIMVDDANQYLDFSFFFSALTGEMVVNPKSTKSYEISFDKVPKFCFTSNYPPKDNDPSTQRRLLYTVFSDYFHFNKDNEYNEDRSIRDVFGKNLFNDFTPEEWNYFMNTMAYCLHFFLVTEDKINPPMENVNKRHLKAEMSDILHAWADSYFSNSIISDEFSRKDAYTDFLDNSGVNQRFASPTKFKKQLKAWCKFYGYELNKDRILRTVNGLTTEYMLIKYDEIKHRTDTENSPFN